MTWRLDSYSGLHVEYAYMENRLEKNMENCRESEVIYASMAPHGSGLWGLGVMEDWTRTWKRLHVFGFRSFCGGFRVWGITSQWLELRLYMAVSDHQYTCEMAYQPYASKLPKVCSTYRPGAPKYVASKPPGAMTSYDMLGLDTTRGEHTDLQSQN